MCAHSNRQKQNQTFSSLSLHTEARCSSVVARCRLLMKAPDWSGGSLSGSCHAGSLPSKPQSLLGDVGLGPPAVFSCLVVATVWIFISLRRFDTCDFYAFKLLCRGFTKGKVKGNELRQPLRAPSTDFSDNGDDEIKIRR